MDLDSRSTGFFQNIEEFDAKSPDLAYPHYSKPFVLYSDASAVGIGAVFLQKQEEKFTTIRYLSRTLTSAE
jgi:hypothetical protein